MAAYLDKRFKDVEGKLNRSCTNIEEVVELEEYITSESRMGNFHAAIATSRGCLKSLYCLRLSPGLGTVVAPLQEGIDEMMMYHDVLDDHKLAATDQYIHTLYSTFGWPAKLQKQVMMIMTRIGKRPIKG